MVTSRKYKEPDLAWLSSSSGFTIPTDSWNGEGFYNIGTTTADIGIATAASQKPSNLILNGSLVLSGEEASISFEKPATRQTHIENMGKWQRHVTVVDGPAGTETYSYYILPAPVKPSNSSVDKITVGAPAADVEHDEGSWLSPLYVAAATTAGSPPEPEGSNDVDERSCKVGQSAGSTAVVAALATAALVLASLLNPERKTGASKHVGEYKRVK